MTTTDPSVLILALSQLINSLFYQSKTKDKIPRNTLCFLLSFVKLLLSLWSNVITFTVCANINKRPHLNAIQLSEMCPGSHIHSDLVQVNTKTPSWTPRMPSSPTGITNWQVEFSQSIVGTQNFSQLQLFYNTTSPEKCEAFSTLRGFIYPSCTVPMMEKKTHQNRIHNLVKKFADGRT